MSRYGLAAPGIFTSPGYPGGPNAGPPPVQFYQNKATYRYGETSLWSTQRYAGTSALANNTSGRLFSIGLGSTGQGLVNAASIAETNLKVGGFVPDGQAYDVSGISALVYSSSSTADNGTCGVAYNTSALVNQLINVQNNAVLIWNFTQTTIEIAPLHMVGAGGGAYGAVATTVNDTSSGHMNNGAANMWVYRDEPVGLPGNSVFAILLQFGSRAAVVATNDLFVKVTLTGRYKNVIEGG